MISTASSSSSRRSSANGQSSPRMRSLSASPLPSPSRKRPGMRVATVAAAWAMIAGCVRTVGHVTAVTHPIVLVTEAMPPRTAHTNGL